MFAIIYGALIMKPCEMLHIIAYGIGIQDVPLKSCGLIRRWLRCSIFTFKFIQFLNDLGLHPPKQNSAVCSHSSEPYFKKRKKTDEVSQIRALIVSIVPNNATLAYAQLQGPSRCP